MLNKHESFLVCESEREHEQEQDKYLIKFVYITKCVCLCVLQIKTNIYMHTHTRTRTPQEQMDVKFKKQFPTRKELEIVSSTRIWKREDKAARTLQNAWREYLR